MTMHVESERAVPHTILLPYDSAEVAKTISGDADLRRSTPTQDPSCHRRQYRDVRVHTGDLEACATSMLQRAPRTDTIDMT